MRTSNAIVTRQRSRARRKGAQKTTTDPIIQYGADAWSLAKRTAYGLNEIRKLINIETKFIDTTVNNAAQNAVGNNYAISQLAQGLQSTNRVGDSVRIQHLEVRGRININPAATNTPVRVIVYRDLDGYGTSPTTADVLENVSAGQTPFSPYKFQKMKRFSILFDETFVLQSILAAGSSSCTFFFSTAHQGHVLYLGTTAAAASDGKGSVYVLVVSDDNVNAPTATFTSRMMFTDD